MNEPPSHAAPRLSLRTVGDMWAAFYASSGEEKDAIFLGSIKLSLIQDRPRRKAQFIALMQGAISDVVQERFGMVPTFGEEEPLIGDRSGDT
jgi:hypothetical protein